MLYKVAIELNTVFLSEFQILCVAFSYRASVYIIGTCPDTIAHI